MDSRFPRPGVEGRQHGPAVGAAGDGREGTYQGVLNSVPSGGQCMVVIPALDPLHQHETYCRADASGDVGDLVIVAFAEKLLYLLLNLGRSSL